jgi:hypothetical protein
MDPEFDFVYCIGPAVALVFAIFVATDANKRGMNGLLWGIGVFLICIIFLPLYLVVRKPVAEEHPASTVAPGGAHCSGCGYQLSPGASFCPNCGKPAQG